MKKKRLKLFYSSEYTKYHFDYIKSKGYILENRDVFEDGEQEGYSVEIGEDSGCYEAEYVTIDSSKVDYVIEYYVNPETKEKLTLEKGMKYTTNDYNNDIIYNYMFIISDSSGEIFDGSRFLPRKSFIEEQQF